MNKSLLIILFSLIYCKNLRDLAIFNWENYYNDLINAHNDLRARHGSPALIRDKQLEKWAQETADESMTAETLKSGETYKEGKYVGINLYLGGGYSRTGKYVTEYWYSENRNYDYSTGNSKNGSPVSHFTQIVWKHTKKVGCAVSVGRWKIFSQSYYICCYYYPGGNLSGKYIENVGRP